MKINKAQRWKILKLWTSVCKDRGWKSSDRELRLRTIGGLIGRELTTLDDVERVAECTKVMAELEAMLGVSVEAGKEATDPSLNQARNLRHVIRYEVLPCLALYPGSEDPIGFMRAIMADKNRWWKVDRPAVEMTLEDLDAAKLKQLLMTLNARLHVKRRAALHSIHDMKIAAGVKCDCATYCRARVQLVPPLAPPVAESLTKGNPF